MFVLAAIADGQRRRCEHLVNGYIEAELTQLFDDLPARLGGRIGDEPYAIAQLAKLG
jgi:hypothetical protein